MNVIENIEIGDYVACYDGGSGINNQNTSYLEGYVTIENGKMCVAGNHMALGCAENIEILRKKKVKIIQLLPMENNAQWQGAVIGLGDDGVVYESTKSGWMPIIPLEFVPSELLVRD